MRRIARMKVPKMPKKKVVNTTNEIVSHCEQCGNPLGRTNQRTQGSAVCAMSVGVTASKINDKWMFFCSQSCKEMHENNLQPSHSVPSDFLWNTVTRTSASTGTPD